MEEDASKRSSLKSISKTIPAQSTVPQALSTIPKWNTMGTQCSTEAVPDHTDRRNIYTFDTFSIFVLILIITLVFLNLYLFVELYMLKQRHIDSIQIDQEILDQLASAA